MKPEEEILSFLDLLDLDEEVIDLKIKYITNKSNFTSKSLKNLIHLLRYKQLINIKEDSECENDEEYKIIGDLLCNIVDDNIELIAKIINAILRLNPSSVVGKSEHLLQQILADMYLPSPNKSIETENAKLNLTFLQLKVCESILEAVINCKQKLSLPFLQTRLEHILCTTDDNLNTYFLTSIIPRFFECVEGYNILDRIWNFLKHMSQKEICIKVLCCLSNYYLPITRDSDFESYIILYSEFWDIIFSGLNSSSNKKRKYSVYLFKRALDCLIISNRDINVNSECVFIWKSDKKQQLKKNWDDYFVLIDSLEEKQSNIVLPSLKLFNSVDIHHCWLRCAFNIALNHDNAQVRFKCIEYRLNYDIYNAMEATTILEAINKTSFFGDVMQLHILESKLRKLLQKESNLYNVLKTIPLIKWAPVPLFFTSRILSELDLSLSIKGNCGIPDVLESLLKTQCNNVIIRNAIIINICIFIGKSYKLHWKDYVRICTNVPKEVILHMEHTDNCLINFIKNKLLVPSDEIPHFLESIKSTLNIQFALIYFTGHDNMHFINLINDTVDKINNISERQYSNKSECLFDAIFLSELYRKSLNEFHWLKDFIPNIISSVFNYVRSLLMNDNSLNGDELALLFESFKLMVANYDLNKDTLVQLHKSSLILLKDKNVCLNKRILSIFILNSTTRSPGLLDEQIDVSETLKIIINGIYDKESNASNGRLKNVFTEKSCETVYIVLNRHDDTFNKDILDFIDYIIDSGGYGCLRWILRIMKNVLPFILDNMNYDITQFLNNAWREIEELKSNSQYSTCIEEFVSLLTSDAILKKAMYNNIVIFYCTKIMEYGDVKTVPLFYLIKELSQRNISNYSHMIYILTDILLYSIVPKKETRISEEIVEKIFKDSKYSICEKQGFHFISHIRYLSVLTLSKIKETEILNTIIDFIRKRIDEVFKTKERYHANSQAHRTVLAAVQTLLFITLKSRSINVELAGSWCIELLGRLPHQQYVRTCLEWYIALYIYVKGLQLNRETLKGLQSKNVPIASQFLILYYVLIRKMKTRTYSMEEYHFVIDTLLSHSMGPTYSTRLYAQYLTLRVRENSIDFDSEKYEYIIEVIRQTMSSASADKDKTYQKLLKDYFVHEFDIVTDLTPCQIYHVLPKSDNLIENIDVAFFENIIRDIDENIDSGTDSFYDEWKECRTANRCLGDVVLCESIDERNESDELGTIQKKYVPWKSMSDVDVYDGQKKGNKSDLIVVASLIDRLPNLGGMARTSEVFGVLTYVVDSLRHLQDKQFQGLSVSAERWIDVEEVRPGQPLKDYLMMKRTEGYSVVAAEQTSSSVTLQSFKFPKKTLLLLGHEKEGIPCDLLPLMDSCVEIPQQGVIRSLNVHVTAAIFIWEYARQNML